MRRGKEYPEWFLNEIADEKTKSRFIEGLGKVSEYIYFRCFKGHPNYKQLVKNHITSDGKPLYSCPICAKESKVFKEYPSWVIEDLVYEEDRKSVLERKCTSNKILLFVCTKCGSFYEQSLYNHSIGKRLCFSCVRKYCGKSYKETMSKKRKPYPQWFIDELVNEEDKQRALVGDISGTEKLVFRCLENEKHRNYIQEVKNHICISTGTPRCGCPECRYIKSAKRKKEFCNKVRKDFPLDMYSDVYKESDRSLLENKRISYNKKIEFLCPICGNVYEQIIKDHIRGKRCSYCSGKVSKEEINVRNIIDKFYKGEVIYNNRSILRNIELDIYIPDKKIAIEYNGSYWHRTLPGGEGSKTKNYHNYKYLSCLKKGIHLINIYDVDFLFRKEKVESFLKDLFIQRNKIYARNCDIKQIDYHTANSMYEEYHLLGKTTNITVSYGLFYNNQLISCMSFQKGRYKNNKKSVWCLTRFVTKSEIFIIGGASKLLRKFEKDFSPSILVSYSDNDYFIGSVYSRLGFECLGDTKAPRYYWFLDGKEIKREQCQLRHLSKQYPDLYKKSKYIDGNKEDYIMLNLGAYKIYRSGNTKWIKHYKENIDEKN